ncbi:uroporphyrinogen-III synthase [Endozoicomonas montiporae]|uniref:Uroporphyrinogen-III synthase n=1 Tax=Endozoicomonas montiporae CL-33 TaxID=570277 RepID=A0A142B7F5_9GAMM|nr:uroporphyrinogen-III synthase [Endozoicomonas montiporae]AMO54681.1 uroporphyrinogen III synthase HEM4 [Endozoicomonas montiporae CL-33]
MPDNSLNRIRALVTRPNPQGNRLAEHIQQQGGETLVLPMLEIRPLAETQAMRERVLQLDRYQKIIAISKHAAQYGLELIENYWPQLPVGQQWFAIGNTTRQTLARFDVSASCSDQGNDSESLLALDEFSSPEGQSILLIKGSGGRDFLEKALQQKGAQVDTLEVYQRLCPDYQPNQVRQQLSDHGINVILAGSGETIRNLCQHLPMSLLEHYRLVIPGQRVARQAKKLGFRQVYTATGADHAAMLSVLEKINDETSL